MPDIFIIIFFVVVFAAALTYVIPVGKYNTQGIPLFEEGGEVGFTNYAFEGLVSGDKWG